MKIFASFITGLLSAILLFTLCLASPLGAALISASSSLLLLLFLFLWGISTYAVSGGSRSASTIWARGGLIGAFEWLLVGFVMLRVMFGVLMNVTERGVSPVWFGGALLASGVVTTIGLPFVLFMLLGSIAVWFVARNWEREFAETSETDKPIRRPCPHCAEQILPAATTCPFCKLAVEEQQVCSSCNQVFSANALYCTSCCKSKLLQPES
jgi:hypothetical protein